MRAVPGVAPYPRLTPTKRSAYRKRSQRSGTRLEGALRKQGPSVDPIGLSVPRDQDSARSPRRAPRLARALNVSTPGAPLIDGGNCILAPQMLPYEAVKGVLVLNMEHKGQGGTERQCLILRVRLISLYNAPSDFDLTLSGTKTRSTVETNLKNGPEGLPVVGSRDRRATMPACRA